MLPSVFGRQDALSDLDRAFDAALGGHPTTLVVEGPAGIGKTVVVEHFLSGHDDLRTFRCSGASWESSVPFGVAGQLWRADDAHEPDPGQNMDVLTATAKLVDRWSWHTELVVVVVDDAHWADVESLRALSSAQRRMTAEKVLIVLIARDDEPETSEAVRTFLTEHRGPTIRIGPLRATDVQALAIQWAGVHLSAPTARRLTEHTLGNPRHTKQLLREVPAERWRAWEPTLPAPRELAAGVVRALHARSPSARSLVESAAVLGRTATFADAVGLARIEDPVAALDEASGAGLLELASGGDLTVIGFPTPLVRAAVYADLGPLRLQELHEKAAEVAEDERTRLLHRVAITPYADADLADELTEFASRQATLGAWSVVGEALINASRLSPSRADRENRLVRAVDALVGAGELPRAIAYSSAIESFPATALRDAVTAYLAILRGRPAEAELLLTSAWQRCDPAREPDVAALICQRRVLHSMGRWNGHDLVRWGRRAVELVKADTPTAVEAEAIMGLGLAATGLGQQAKDSYDEMAEKIGPGAQSQRVQMAKGWIDLALDDPQTARRELEFAVPTEYRMGSTRISLWAQSWLARTEFALGLWDDALRMVDRAVALLETSELELVRPLVHWTGAQTHALRGNWHAAHEHLQRGSATASDYEIMLVPSCLARAHCAEAQADYQTVLRSLEPVANLPQRQGIDEPGFWPWPDIYANALVMTNRVDEADAFLTPHEERARARQHRSARARLGYVRGRIEGAAGDIDAAKEAFEGALLHLRGLPLPYERARVNFSYGQTLRRAGKRREADVVLQAARDAYQALGAKAYVERCDRELKAGGLHAKRGAGAVAGADLAPLTAQEQAVARLVAAGMTNKQAAVELYLSVKTVQFHLTRIYSKLGLSSRGELAARFRDHPEADTL